MQVNKAIKLKRVGNTIVENIARYVFLIAFSYVLIYPIIFLIAQSFMSPTDKLDPSVLWVAKEPGVANLVNGAKLLDFGKALLSTVVNLLVAGGLEVVTCLIFAYGLSRYEFKGKKLLTFMMLLTILIPSSMTIIPTYLNMQSFDVFGIFGLINKITGTDLRPSFTNSPLAFYIPSIFGVGLRGGLFIFIYSQFFKSLPKELEEAASVDGAGLYTTLFKIVVPSSGVAIVTVLMLSMIWHWNEYYLPQILLADNYPLSVQLKNIAQRAYISANKMMQPYNYNLSVPAACLLTIIPVLIFYLVLQRKFIASIANSGIVG